jgi:hypothetical protein
MVHLPFNHPGNGATPNVVVQRDLRLENERRAIRTGLVKQMPRTIAENATTDIGRDGLNGRAESAQIARA